MKWIAVLLLFASLIFYSKAVPCDCPYPYPNCPPVTCPNKETPVFNSVCPCCPVCPALKRQRCEGDCGLPCARNLECDQFRIQFGYKCGICKPILPQEKPRNKKFKKPDGPRR
ncbi:uncharacterized protein LOC120346686 [Styela clava]